MTRNPPIDNSRLIHDWNVAGGVETPPARAVELVDETLRDGLQSPSVVDPPIHDKKELLRLMDRLGVAVADIGLPGAGARMTRHVTSLCECIRDERLSIRAACAARTLPRDIEPVIEISHETGVTIELLTFLGASPIRAYAEDWTTSHLRQLTAVAVRTGVRGGLPVSFVTEDTVRAHPDVLEQLFRTAIDEGAERLVLCDTVGHATPQGVVRLVTWTRELLDKLNRNDIRLDFHGHNDRGLALINSLTAYTHGCERLHGTALGIGERVGNTSIDQLMVNLSLIGAFDHDLSDLIFYCRRASDATGRLIPQNYPVVGSDAFRTATGVHASAILKAQRKDDGWTADRIYSGVPAELVGKRQQIEIGYMSGVSNILAWLHAHQLAPNPALVAEITRVAKLSHRTLEESEITEIIERVLHTDATVLGA